MQFLLLSAAVLAAPLSNTDGVFVLTPCTNSETMYDLSAKMNRYLQYSNQVENQQNCNRIAWSKLSCKSNDTLSALGFKVGRLNEAKNKQSDFAWLNRNDYSSQVSKEVNVDVNDRPPIAKQRLIQSMQKFARREIIGNQWRPSTSFGSNITLLTGKRNCPRYHYCITLDYQLSNSTRIA